MATSVLHEIREVVGRIKFSKVIVDGYCHFDEFEEEIKRTGNLRKQVDAIYSMDQIVNLQRLPLTKFRAITPKGDDVKEFEIKKGDLRVYLIKEESHIIIVGGKKNSQQKDIRKLRSLKRRYNRIKITDS